MTQYDYRGVGCEDYREALSAQLDREDPGIDAAQVDAHLAGCAGCREWLRQAVHVTRAVRVQPADEVPDLTEAILARVGSEAPVAVVDRRARRTAVVRVGLFAVAAGQWATGLAVTFAPVTAGVAVHGAHELGAFNLALAVAFGAAAWRPSRARAHLPLLATLVAGLAVLTAADVAVGHATLVTEAAHLLLVAGLVLTAVLARGYPAPGNPPAGSGAGGSAGGFPGRGAKAGPRAPLPGTVQASDDVRKVA